MPNDTFSESCTRRDIYNADPVGTDGEYSNWDFEHGKSAKGGVIYNVAKRYEATLYLRARLCVKRQGEQGYGQSVPLASLSAMAHKNSSVQPAGYTHKRAAPVQIQAENTS